MSVSERTLRYGGMLLVAATVLIGAHAARANEQIHVGKAQGTAWTFLPVDIGIAQGFFAQQGLDIDSADLGGDAKVQQALAAGSIDIGLGSGPGLAFVAKGSPGIGVAAFAGPPRNISAIVLEDSPIKTIADLKGKLIAVSSVGSLSDWLAKQMAIQEGWGQDGIRAVPLGAVEISIAALKAKQVDAVVLSTEAGFGLEERKQGRMLASMDRYAPHFITHVVFAQKSLVASKPDTVRRFLKGFFAANRVHENPSRRNLRPGRARAAPERGGGRQGLRFRGRHVHRRRPLRSTGGGGAETVLHRYGNAARAAGRRRAVHHAIPAGRAITGINRTMTTATTPITNPNVTRSRLVLEIASEMAGGAAADAVPDYILPKVELRHSRGGKPVTFSGVSSAEGIFAVAAREVDLAMINPAAVLSVALRGEGIFKKPMPVRAIAVIPSWDAFVFAVRPETGLARFEDIAARKPKLRILMRATPDHSLHHMFDDVAAAAGFSRDDIARWGGEVRKSGSVPWPYTETFKALIRGDVDAIFDEAAHSWVPQALDAGITILPLAETTVAKLEATGYRRAVLPKSAYPKLPHDVLSLDFSGWTVFVHAEADDALVTQICMGLDARKARIAWEEPGDLPVERMAREALDTPQCVPLHPAAERFWRGRGYL